MTTSTVTVVLPKLLEPAVGKTRLQVSGGTIVEVLEAAFDALPGLRHHLQLDSGQLRPHLLCLVNDQLVDRSEHLSRLLADGDELLIHQAISGG